MKRLLSCEFNLDTACVELCFSDGSMVSIDTIAVENEVVNNMYQQSELDYLIYNDPAAYADLILNGDPAVYLKTVTEYKNLDDVYTNKATYYKQSKFHITSSISELVNLGQDTAINRTNSLLSSWSDWNKQAIEERQEMFYRLSEMIWELR